jgi:hypothetical protein
MANAEVKLEALVKKITRTLKDEKDPESKEVTGHYVETQVALLVVDLDADAAATLAALQGDGELVVEISRRQGALFKGSRKEPKGAAHDA